MTIHAFPRLQIALSNKNVPSEGSVALKPKPHLNLQGVDQQLSRVRVVDSLLHVRLFLGGHTIASRGKQYVAEDLDGPIRKDKRLADEAGSVILPALDLVGIALPRSKKMIAVVELSPNVGFCQSKTSLHGHVETTLPPSRSVTPSTLIASWST